jgi:predicted acyltransferase
MMNPNRRLLSLDTLRGVDMFFIMGFSGLVTSLCALWPGSFTDMLASQMQHAAWNGLTIQDTIFPLFLFIAGVAFPFSLAKQRARGFGRKRILDRIFRRGLILALLGMVYNGLFELNFSSLRIASVLGRIGLAWMFAALLCVYCSVRTRIAVAGIILIGYSLLLGLVVAPDAPVGADPLSVEGCLAGWIDRQYLPGHILYGAFDPEGILSTLPAVVSECSPANFCSMAGEGSLALGKRSIWPSPHWRSRRRACAGILSCRSTRIYGAVRSLAWSPVIRWG